MDHLNEVDGYIITEMCGHTSKTSDVITFSVEKNPTVPTKLDIWFIINKEIFYKIQEKSNNGYHFKSHNIMHDPKTDQIIINMIFEK